MVHVMLPMTHQPQMNAVRRNHLKGIPTAYFIKLVNIIVRLSVKIRLMSAVFSFEIQGILIMWGGNVDFRFLTVTECLYNFLHNSIKITYNYHEIFIKMPFI